MSQDRINMGIVDLYRALNVRVTATLAQYLCSLKHDHESAQYWKREAVNAILSYVVFDNTTFSHAKHDNTPYTGPDFLIARNRALSLVDGAVKVFEHKAVPDAADEQLRLNVADWLGLIDRRIKKENYL